MKKKSKEPYQTIKILILEDVPEDAELMRRELEKAGYKLKHVVVDDEFSFTSELINFKPDLILADHMLPTFSGLDALEITQDYDPGIPFVFVTGSIGEEMAAETILHGASGFVLKSNLSKLPVVVKEGFSSDGKWYNRRLARGNKRINTQVKANLQLLKKIYGFLDSKKETASKTEKELKESINKLLHLATNPRIKTNRL